MSSQDPNPEAESASPRADSATHPTVAAIGTSAGGLSALREFFKYVDSDSGLAYVVVVHLSPEHESHLTEILQPHARVPVQQVTETVPLAPNRVYLIPPNANLEAIDTHLRVSPLRGSPHPRAPIDHFFRTLAQTHGGHAIGVILTGTGSDGTLGLKQIKEKGGLTVVQDPKEAEYDGMPRSAIATGLVDLVLPLARIPDALRRYAETEPKIALPVDGEPAKDDWRGLLQKVFAQIRARTGRDFNVYKQSTILRRVARRMQLAQIEEFGAYLQHLRDKPEEVTALADDLLITVTTFFRDREVFSKLEEFVVPRLFDNKGAGDQIRVWCVGCATGEEAYSLAILLLEEAARQEGVVHFQVFATDMHEHSLGMAREGFYRGAIETDVSPERLRRFFIKEDGGYRIRKEVRERVVFAHHNLLGDPPFSRIDLISCRNLLIYLERHVQRDVIELFHYGLRPDGTLLLGPSETIDAADLFHVEHKKQCIFRRRNVPGPEPRLPVFPLARLRSPHEAERPQRSSEPIAYGGLHQRLLELAAPPSLLVSTDDRIVHLSEGAGRYLVHPGGELTSSAYKLVREELRIELRNALLEARTQGTRRRSQPIPVRFNGELVHIALEALPSRFADGLGFVLVTFYETREAEAANRAITAEGESEGDADLRVEELKADRVLMRQRLQALIEEYETTQEESKASNEELQSTNEELRSTLEELETSKEELQSMNEELQTVNQENRHKVEELSQLSADLQNLLTATDIATLFLDRDLRILRFTPRVGELFHVRATDRGRPLSDLTHRLVDSQLLEDAGSVLERLVPIEREVHDQEGRWYLTRVLPYRSVDDRIDGVVVTFVDITVGKVSEEALRDLNETLEQRVTERTQQVRQLAASLTMAEHQERRRISQMLHDELQQLLYAIQMKLTHMRERPSAARELVAQLDKSLELLAYAISHTRQLTIDLSPPLLEGDGLLESLQWIRTQMRELHGLEVEIREKEPVRLEHDGLRVLLFQAVRELLFNVKKHSGAERAVVEIEQRDGTATITVSDAGRGFDPDSIALRDDADRGWGLFNVRERLRLQGGDMAIRSRDRDGAKIVIHVPTAPSGSPTAARSDGDR